MSRRCFEPVPLFPISMLEFTFGSKIKQVDRYSYHMGEVNHSVTISPRTVGLEGRNWHASASFKVQNNTDGMLYQIRIKLDIEHPHIRIDDFTIGTPTRLHESYKEIVPGKDSEERARAKYLVIKRLNPHETWQFTVNKCTPYIDSTHRQPVLHASILGFDKDTHTS